MKSLTATHADPHALRTCFYSCTIASSWYLSLVFHGTVSFLDHVHSTLSSSAVNICISRVNGASSRIKRRFYLRSSCRHRSQQSLSKPVTLFHVLARARSYTYTPPTCRVRRCSPSLPRGADTTRLCALGRSMCGTLRCRAQSVTPWCPTQSRTSAPSRGNWACGLSCT